MSVFDLTGQHGNIIEINEHCRILRNRNEVNVGSTRAHPLSTLHYSSQPVKSELLRKTVTDNRLMNFPV